MGAFLKNFDATSKTLFHESHALSFDAKRISAAHQAASSLQVKQVNELKLQQGEINKWLTKYEVVSKLIKDRNEAMKKMAKSKSKLEALNGNMQAKNFAEVGLEAPNRFPDNF